MKIRNFTFLIISSTTLVVLLILFVYSGIINSIRFYVNLNETYVDEIHEYQLKLNGSIQQLNVSNTNDSFGIIKDNAMDHILIIQNQAISLKNGLTQLNEASLSIYTEDIQNISSELLLLQINLDSLYFNLTNNLKPNEVIDSSLNNNNDIESVVFSLSNAYEIVNNTITSDINTIINLFISLMVLIIGLLLMGLFRFAYYNLERIANHLNQSDQRYSSNKGIKAYFSEEKQIDVYLDQKIDSKLFIEQINDVIYKHIDIKQLIDAIFPILHDSLKIDRIGVAFVDYKNQVIVSKASKMTNDTKLNEGYSMPFVRTSLYDLIESKKYKINHDLVAQFEQRPNSLSLKLLIDEGIKSNLIYPLLIGNEVYGFLFLSSTRKDFFGLVHLNRVEQLSCMIQSLLIKTYLLHDNK